MKKNRRQKSLCIAMQDLHKTTPDKEGETCKMDGEVLNMIRFAEKDTKLFRKVRVENCG